MLHQPTKDNGGDDTPLMGIMGEGSAPLVHVNGDHGEVVLHYAPKLGDVR